MRIERLGEEWFEYDERGHALAGERSGTLFRLGDRIEVRVTRVDTIARRVDLALASVAAEAGSARPAPPRRRTPFRAGRADRRGGRRR